MAGEVPPLNVEILVSLGNLTNAVNQATEGLNKIGNTAKAQESKFLSLKTVMVGTFAGGEIQQGIRMLTDFLKESVKAAEQAQLSTTQLATAMNDAKINTEANRKVVEASIGSMEKLAFTHTDATQAMTKMVLATGSVANSQKEMATVADYARVKQISLSDAATTLTKASGGMVRAFKEYHIELDTSLSKHDALIKAMDQLSGKIKDQAAAYLKTYAGQMADLNAKMEKVKETVGSILLPILRKLADMFLEVTSYVSKHKDLMIVLIAVIGTALVAALVAAASAAWAMISPFLAAIAPFAAVAAAVALLWNHFKVFRDVVVDAVKVVITYLGYFIGFIAKIVEAASHLPVIGSHFKGIATELNKAAVEVGNFGGKLDGLKNKKISLNFSALTPDLAGGASGGADGSGFGGGDVGGSSLSKSAAALKKAQDNMVKLKDEQNKILLDRQTKMDVALSDLRTKELDAHTKFDQTKLDIETKYQDAVETATTAHQDAIEKANETHQDNIIKINQAAVDKQKAIIQQSVDAMTSGFASVTKFDLAKSFSGTGTTSGLISSMQNQLTQIVQLQKDAGDLAAKGYSQSFINQVIAQGPQVGDQMSQAILNATPQTADQIKSLYDQIDTVSNSGLDTLAQTMNDGTTFATSAMAKQYAQVAVDLQTSLANENSTYQDSLTAAQVSFDNAMTSAGNARDLALQKAQQVLTDSLTSAQQAYDKSIQAISDSTMSKLDALMAKMITAAALLAKLGGGTTALPATSYSPMPLLPATTANVGANIGIIDANIASLGKAVGAGVTINAPITVDGSTSASQIQSNLLMLAKFGSGTGSGY
jgi:hypothetical protein